MSALPAGGNPVPRLTVADRVLDVLSVIGPATTRQVCDRMREAGYQVSLAHASVTLNALARRDPPAVTAQGGPGARTWRLAAGAPQGEAGRGWTARRESVPWPLARNAARNAKALRARLGLGVEETAALAGTSTSHLRMFEGGSGRLSWERLGGLARALGSTPEELTGDRCAACGSLPSEPGHAEACGDAA